MSDNPALIEAIRREITQNGGPITFARYMDLVLYHPQHGYYTSGRTRIGKEGDYFTSVSVGPLFGKILARQFRQFREKLGNPPDFQVIECGAHRGQLRQDILAAAPELPYRAIEVADPLPDKITGVIFSNELLDALPVHRVCVSKGQWQEIYVETAPTSPSDNPPHPSNPRTTSTSPPLPSPSPSDNPPHPCNPWITSPPPFRETLAPLSTPRLTEALQDLPVHLMEGYRTEINLRALDWQADIAQRLQRGYLLTIDYGYLHEEYFAPHHREGTLLCYHRHTKNDNPYLNIGHQDITTHVNFSSLIDQGENLGLETVQYTDQSHYLLEIGRPDITEIVERTAGEFSKERNAIHQLLHPELMGRTFKVLVQQKGL